MFSSLYSRFVYQMKKKKKDGEEDEETAERIRPESNGNDKNGVDAVTPGTSGFKRKHSQDEEDEEHAPPSARRATYTPGAVARGGGHLITPPGLMHHGGGMPGRKPYNPRGGRGGGFSGGMVPTAAQGFGRKYFAGQSSFVAEDVARPGMNFGGHGGGGRHSGVGGGGSMMGGGDGEDEEEEEGGFDPSEFLEQGYTGEEGGGGDGGDDGDEGGEGGDSPDAATAALVASRMAAAAHSSFMMQQQRHAIANSSPYNRRSNSANSELFNLYQCDRCTYTTNYMNQLRNHLKMKHGVLESYKKEHYLVRKVTFHCKVCGRSYSGDYCCVMNHLKNHNMTVRQYFMEEEAAAAAAAAGGGGGGGQDEAMAAAY